MIFFSKGGTNYLDELSIFTDNITARAKVLSCNNGEPPVLDAGDWVMIAVLVIFGIIVIVSTILDVCVNVLAMDPMPVHLLPTLQGNNIDTRPWNMSQMCAFFGPKVFKLIFK